MGGQGIAELIIRQKLTRQTLKIRSRYKEFLYKLRVDFNLEKLFAITHHRALYEPTLWLTWKI